MNRSLLLLCGTCAVASVAPRAVGAQTASSDSGLALGRFAVGFRSLVLRDHSRSFRGPAYRSDSTSPTGMPRPIQVSVWYPAQEADVAPLRVLDYRRLSLLGQALNDWTPEQERRFQDSLVSVVAGRGRSAAEALEILLTPAAARIGVPMAEGRFPLVVYGPAMLNGVGGNTVLFEYLASHGFVVAAHPSFGPAFDLMDTGSIGLETQVRDMEHVLGFLIRDYADRLGPIGVLGHSWGGMAAVVLAMRHPDVKAVLSLDSSVEEWATLVYALPDFDVTKLCSPYFHVQTSDGIPATERNGPDAFYEAVAYAPKYRLSLPTLAHYDVVSGRYPLSLDSTAAMKRRLYETVNRFVLGFFEAHLLNNRERLDGLRARYGRRAGQESDVSLEWHTGRRPPPSEADLVRLYLSGERNRAERAIRGARNDEPRAYREQSLVRVAELLLWNWESFAEAVAMLELTTEFYPASSRAHELLGVALWAQGESDEAARSFERSLGLDAGNTRVRGYLAELRGSRE